MNAAGHLNKIRFVFGLLLPLILHHALPDPHLTVCTSILGYSDIIFIFIVLVSIFFL